MLIAAINSRESQAKGWGTLALHSNSCIHLKVNHS